MHQAPGGGSGVGVGSKEARIVSCCIVDGDAGVRRLGQRMRMFGSTVLHPCSNAQRGCSSDGTSHCDTGEARLFRSHSVLNVLDDFEGADSLGRRWSVGNGRATLYRAVMEYSLTTSETQTKGEGM
jgi:hypothetical protein